MGALVADVAQGLFGSFDAIIPASYSHGGGSEASKTECRPPNTPGTGTCPKISKVLFSSYADPWVVEDFVSWSNPPKPTLPLNGALYAGPGAGPHLAPTATI